MVTSNMCKGKPLVKIMVAVCCLTHILTAETDIVAYGTFSDYAHSCRNKESKYCAFSTEWHYEALIRKAETRNVTSLWLPFQRVDFKGFAAVDNSSNMSPFIQGTLNSGDDCAYLDILSPELSGGTNCSNLWLGGICSLKGNECFESKSTFKVGEECFVVFMEKMNWFDAQSHCALKQRHLATFKKREQILQLKKTIEAELGSFEFYYFWIGYRRFDFYVASQFSPTSISIQYSNWDSDQPSSNYTCVAAVKKNRYYSWTVENCSVQLPFLCQELSNDILKDGEEYPITQPLLRSGPEVVTIVPTLEEVTHLTNVTCPCTATSIGISSAVAFMFCCITVVLSFVHWRFKIKNLRINQYRSRGISRTGNNSEKTKEMPDKPLIDLDDLQTWVTKS